MTTKNMQQILWAAILGGAVAFGPTAVWADDDDVPDHQQAEDRKGAETTVPSAEKQPNPPTHEEAENRGQTAPSGLEVEEGIPDHAAAERRGAPAESQ